MALVGNITIRLISNESSVVSKAVLSPSEIPSNELFN